MSTVNSTRSGASDHATATSSWLRDLLGRIRRMVVTRTTSALWQVAGHVLFDSKRETHDAPPFTGIGFYSRPPAGADVEALVLFVGGASNPVIAALRDERTRSAVFKTEDELGEDESAVFNSSAIVRIKADGTIEVRSVGGAGASLALKSDVAAIATAVDNAIAAGLAAGPPIPTPELALLKTALAALPPVGTSVLKGE